MGYFQVRYDSRVINYDLRGFIRLATDLYSRWCFARDSERRRLSRRSELDGRRLLLLL